MKPTITKSTATVDLVNPKEPEDVHTVCVCLKTITEWGRAYVNGDVGYQDESETYVVSHDGPDWVTEDMIKRELQLDY